jgi:hypothetical protein
MNAGRPFFSTIGVPASPQEITADWLTEILAPSGLIGSARIAGTRMARIGEDESFTGGRLYRIELVCAEQAGLSVVAKFSPLDPVLALQFGPANAREVSFYQNRAATTWQHVPHLHFGQHDPGTQSSLLILEDIKDSRTVPFLNGCDEADARSVVSALAAVHARWWGTTDTDSLSRLPPDDNRSFQACWAAYPSTVARHLGPDLLTKPFIAFGDFLASHQSAVFGSLLNRGPLTCLHRDLHIDNVMFRRSHGPEVPVLIDWQMAGPGPGAYDLAYLMISSMPPALRRRTEREIVAFYHAELVSHGVSGYPANACWQDYLRSFIGKLWLTVVATVAFDKSTPHKIAWRRTDLARLLAFFDDHAISPDLYRQET